MVQMLWNTDTSEMIIFASSRPVPAYSYRMWNQQNTPADHGKGTTVNGVAGMSLWCSNNEKRMCHGVCFGLPLTTFSALAGSRNFTPCHVFYG